MLTLNRVQFLMALAEAAERYRRQLLTKSSDEIAVEVGIAPKTGIGRNHELATTIHAFGMMDYLELGNPVTFIRAIAKLESAWDVYQRMLETEHA